MSCTKEEIERKRLAALEKRKSKTFQSPCNPSDSLASSTITSPLRVVNPHAAKLNSNNGTKQTFHPYKLDAKKESAAVVGNGSVTKIVTATTYLISEERFEVNPSAFSSPLIDVFKTIPSKGYDAKTRLWSFSINDYELLMQRLDVLRPHIVVGPIPPHILKIVREPMVNLDGIDLSPIEQTLRDKLLPFQAEGVRFGIAKGGRCMIADDMGLGKTFQALALASYYRMDWPLLIVTTSSMRETWQQKIGELLPSVPLLSVATLTGSRDGEAAADTHTSVVVVSYKTSTMHAELLRQRRFGVVIIDESHYLKSPKAQCTVSLTAITRCARRVVLLSGTPALSRPVELYTQLALIENKFMSFTEYGKRYCAGKLGPFGWDMSGQSNLTELQIVLQARFLIRRTKEQVLSNMKEKVREAVLLDPSQLRASSQERAELSEMAQRLSGMRSSEKHAALLTMFSQSAAVKAEAVCKYISDAVRDEPCKMLVFAHHKIILEAVCLTLDRLCVGYVSITGNTKTELRATLVDRFQTSESCRVAVLSITAASSGLTLTAAQLVIFAELHWNPGILTQAEARAHRIGQRGGVRVRYLLAKGTSDDFMWPMLQHKLNILNEVGLSEDNFRDTTCTVQENSNSMLKYLTSPSGKNKNDFIPGTNIRKSQEAAISNHERCGVSDKKSNDKESKDADVTIWEDEGVDDLLAELEF